MREITETPPIVPEDQLLWLIEGTGLSGKTTVANTLTAHGFAQIGRGHQLRGVTSLYLEDLGQHINGFDADRFADFLERRGEEVQAVLRGDYNPAYERRSAMVNAYVGKVSETEAAQDIINGFTFDELQIMARRGIDRVVVEGRALPEIFTEATVAGIFVGRIVGNLHLTVSDDVAGDRAQAKAQKEGLHDFDRIDVLARLRARNETDRNRDRHPMVLNPNAHKIDTPGHLERAKVLGGYAVFEADEFGLPACIHIHTDELLEGDITSTMANLVKGALFAYNLTASRPRQEQMV